MPAIEAANELAATVTEAADRFGDRVAIVDPAGRRTTYDELDRASDEVAAWMQRQGLAPGELVTLALPSSADHLVIQAGAAKAGVAFASLNPRQTEQDRAVALEVLAPDLVIGTVDLVSPTARNVVHVRVDPERPADEVRQVGGRPVHVDADDDRTLAIVLTSGTTGTPKAAVFTNHQVRAVRALDHGTAWGGGGPMLVSTELCHVGVATKLSWYLRSGATLHLLDRWRASDALDVIERAGVTTVGGISSQFALLLRDPGFDRRELGHVRALIAGGGPSSPALVKEARARFGAPYSIRYSSTESGGVGCATAFDAPDDEALHTVGRPRPGVEVRIGEAGRVCLRSPAVMARYHRDPDQTAETLVDGWLVTSDHGHLDGLGRLVLDGRAHDSWVRGGHNIFPEPIEALLADHPGVREVVVVPRSDEVMGQIAVAWVVPRDPADPPDLASLRRLAGARLSKHALPEDLRLVSRLPRTPTDKVDRRALADRSALADRERVD